MHSFDRNLMNTSFEILIPNGERNYAKSAAFDCFDETEALEAVLSLYRFGSDVSCVNASAVGEITPITADFAECLSLAFAASSMSLGAVDVCMGEYFLRAKGDKTFPIPETPRRGKFEFDPENFRLKKIEDGRIDLGSIGKGFALARAVKRLKEIWEIDSAFLTFGASSIYAFGENGEGKPWSVNLSDAVKIDVRDFAVGASGTSVLGSHIVDARTGKIPENQPFRTWCFCADAAIADAMATAFMALSPDEIRRVCKEENLGAAVQRTDGGEIEFFE